MTETDAYPRLTFTMTCGRRLDLFRRTMDSFLQNCLDQDLIDRWIAGDDRSPPEDLKAMRAEYPFLEVHSSPRPGQPASLNHLFAKGGPVGTEWACHWEDDWATVRRGHFLREAMEVASSDPRIRNVVLRGWQGPFVKDGPLQYRYHVYWPRGSLWWQTNDCLWLGYSLNPGLQHMPTVRSLGPYAEDADSRFFDRPAAAEYLRRGLLRANLIEPYVEHIGEGRGAWELS
jgi:hypothetical protein